MSKLVVGVLRGGPSHEYEVSLATGQTVLNQLPEEKYKPVDIFISRDGEWHVDGRVRTPADALRGMDVAFNALHGQYGEDGQVQKMLDDIGMKYTGADAVSSALSMHKARAKDVFARAGIKIPAHRIVHKGAVMDTLVREIFESMFLPLIVKPASAGSSLGMTLVHDYRDVPRALLYAFAHSDQALIEHYVRGREATCGVIEDYRGSRHYALLPVEIIPHQTKKFFDFDAKYSGDTQELCPGNFSNEEKRMIEDASIKAHDALGLRHYSRSDFILTPKGDIYILETNTLPGLTPASLLPKSLVAVGSNMPEFLDHVVSLALK